MDKQTIKKIGKHAIEKGFLTRQIVQQQVKNYKQSVQQGNQQSFLSFLHQQNLINSDQKQELEQALQQKPGPPSGASPPPESTQPASGSSSSRSPSSPRSGANVSGTESRSSSAAASGGSRRGPDQPGGSSSSAQASSGGAPGNAARPNQRQSRTSQYREEQEQQHHQNRSNYRKKKKKNKTTMQLVIGGSVGLIVLVGLMFAMMDGDSGNSGPTTGQSEDTVNEVTYRKMIKDIENKFQYHDHAEAEKLLKEKLNPVLAKLPDELRTRTQDLSDQINSYKQQKQKFVEQYKNIFKKPFKDLPEKNDEKRMNALTSLQDQVNSFEFQHDEFLQKHPHLQDVSDSDKNVKEQIKTLREKIKKRKQKLYTRKYEETKQNISSLLNQEQYRQARSRAKQFTDNFGSSQLSPSASKLKDMVSSRIKKRYETILAEVKTLRENEKWDQAIQKLKDAQTMFGSENLSKKIQDEIAAVERAKEQKKLSNQQEEQEDDEFNSLLDGNENQNESEPSDDTRENQSNKENGDNEIDQDRVAGVQQKEDEQDQKQTPDAEDNGDGQDNVDKNPDDDDGQAAVKKEDDSNDSPGDDSGSANAGNEKTKPGSDGKEEDKSAFDLEETKKWIEKTGRKYTPKGRLSIRHKGAIRGNRGMSNMRKLETPHYIVKTDISKRAVGEIAIVMEMLYYSFMQFPIFQFDPSEFNKLHVLVFKNRSEFDRFRSMPRGVRGYYYRQSEKQQVVTYYTVKDDYRVTNTLLHEGTHQFIDNVTKSKLPIWLNEGLATYFEASSFTKDMMLKQGVVNRQRLESIRKLLKYEDDSTRDLVVPFSRLMRMSHKSFTGLQYSQVWSFVYFLIHAKNNRFLEGLRKYFKTYKKENVTNDPVQLFKEIYGFPPGKLRKPWRKYLYGRTN